LILPCVGSNPAAPAIFQDSNVFNPVPGKMSTGFSRFCDFARLRASAPPERGSRRTGLPGNPQHFVQRPGQFISLHRLLDHQAARQFQPLQLRLTGKKHHRHAGVPFAGSQRQLCTIELGHGEIRQQQVNIVIQQCQCLLAAVRLAHLVAVLA